MSEPIKLVITVDGGLITDISTCGVPIDVVVIDYDVDGASAADGVVRIPGDERAFIGRWADGPTTPGYRAEMLALHDWVSAKLAEAT